MKEQSKALDAFLRLRELALTIERSAIQPASDFKTTRVWGALMENGREDGVVTLVVFADGTASLYFSSGDGIIGASANLYVRQASSAFLAQAEAMLVLLARATAPPLAETGRVRFYVHTTGGPLTAEADEQDLGHGRHPLSPLFHAGHAVITPILRTSAEKPGA